MILAHQGGWDEILLVAGPILVFAGLLRLANRRAEASRADRGLTDGERPDDSGISDDPDDSDVLGDD